VLTLVYIIGFEDYWFVEFLEFVLLLMSFYERVLENQELIVILLIKNFSVKHTFKNIFKSHNTENSQPNYRH